MSLQLPLALTLRDRIDDGSYPDEFWPWLERNGHVFEVFCRVALEGRCARGYRRWSAKGVMEVMRWQNAVAENPEGLEFKLNNNLTPFLARAAMAAHADLHDFFATRIAKTAGRGSLSSINT